MVTVACLIALMSAGNALKGQEAIGERSMGVPGKPREYLHLVCGRRERRWNTGGQTCTAVNMDLDY